MFKYKTPALRKLFSDFENARSINRENLKKILADNADTYLGRKYGFAEIHTQEDYADAVPITDYSDYEGRLHEENAFTAYPVRYTLVTSGTTNKQKQFLLTEEALKRYSAAVHEMPYYLTQTEGVSLHISVFRSPEDGKMLLSSAYHQWLRENGALERNPFLGQYDLLFSNSISDVAYVKAWLGLSCPDLVSIQSVYIYDVLLFFTYLEVHWKDLLEDMESGCIRAELNEDIKRSLLLQKPTNFRIFELKSVFEEGFEEPIAVKLWKKLRFIGGISGAAFALHEQALRRFIGEVPLCGCVYGASECVMGVPVETGRFRYALMPCCAYYEFISLRDQKLVRMEDLEIGESYEMVITTFSGLYRYRMEDSVNVVSMMGETPVIEVGARRGNLLNIAGEKIYEEAMNQALKIWVEKMKLEPGDIAAGTSEERIPGCYCLFVESHTEFDILLAARNFDDALRSVSPDYDDVRKLAMLSMPQVYALPSGEISKSQFEGVKLAHNKPRIFLNRDQVLYLMNRSECNEE